MNHAADATIANNKVQPGKLKEWQYVCNDPLRQEAHDALKQEYDAALEFARSDKLTLEEGLLIKCLGGSYCYSFNVSQLTIQAYQADRPHRLEIGGKHIDGSITAAGDGIIEIEIASNLGDILHRVDVIFDLTVLLDLVDRRIVDIDRDAKNWNTIIAAELFTNLNFPPQSHLVSKCDHQNRLDKKPLKEDQNRVVNHLMQNPFSLIWGPPGTGKSHTLLAGLAEIISNEKTVIFASNTNSAIDNVLEKIIGDDCPYPQLLEYRNSGYIVRLGAQSSKKVMNVFFPKSIARLKSEEINQQLTEFQNNRQAISREIELTSQKIHKWKQFLKKVQQYNETLKKYKELPSLSELENQAANLEKYQALYKQAYQHLSPVLQEVNRELSKLTDEISNSQKRSKAASALLHKHKTEKTEIDTELESVDNQIQMIESSRVKKWFKSKDLEQFKTQSFELNQRIAQLNNQISIVELSLLSSTTAELECISKMQSIIDSIGKYKDAILRINEVSKVLSNDIEKSHIDQQLYNHIKVLSDYTQDDKLKETMQLLFVVAERGWIYSQGNNSFTRSVSLKIQSLVDKKKNANDLIIKIDSLKNGAIEADRFLKKHADAYKQWGPEIDTLKDRISEIDNQISELEKKLEELELRTVKDAKILCLTMVKASYDRHFLEHRYDVLVIDEYSMVSLPQLYCAAAITKERIVLCGDHLQLPPICQSEEENAQKWMGQSIYEWHEGKHEERKKRYPPGPVKLKPHMEILTNQRRMPPEISHLIRPWYQDEGNSLNDEWNTNSDLYIKARSKHILLENNVTILDTTQTNCYSSKSALKGRYNLVHAAIVANLCKEFTENHQIDPMKIICLTPYRLQSILTQTVFHQICPSIASSIAENTSTIHKSQGRGEPIIIYDLTDGKENNLSFFHKSKEPNLLNVALSRSKARIIILCSLNKMIHGLNSAINSPLRSVFQKMAEIKVPVFDGKPYYDAIFKCIDIQSIFSSGTVALTEAQKNGILVLTTKEYYEALSCDLAANVINLTDWLVLDKISS